ncbi:PREDICTED: MYB-like transcription factor ETC3 [Ipomoea nil]|uniref:MYB-like transcription factor ETC3 n=1 Tax=Ipomoea nil TaxID=35883 RepID=UPI000900C28A|nr:PREDICTED: MYB-like transcription factor ETC3 [Ipomoea nil]
MSKEQQQQHLQKKRSKMSSNNQSCSNTEEVSSMEWEFINMSQQEEDLIYRMHKIVGDRWALIAGRIPGRTAEEIERFWIMKHSDAFAHKRHPTSPTTHQIDQIT